MRPNGTPDAVSLDRGEPRLQTTAHAPSGQENDWLGRLAFFPIPLLLTAIAVLWVGDPGGTYESPSLVVTLNLLTRGLASVVIVYLAGRSFLVQRTPGLLLLGCGVAVWGTAGTVTTAAVAHDANTSVTISNLGAWLSGLCHLAGVIFSVRSRRRLGAPCAWLAATYAIALGAVGLLTLATFEGWLPVFFVQGRGGTAVRHLVLGSAIAMFVLAALLLQAAARPASSAFAHWYALALLLIAVGVFGLMIESSRNSVLDWTCRVALCLSGVYMFIAAVASVRASGARGLALRQTPGGASFRYGFALAMAAAAAAVRLALFQPLGTHATYVTFYPAVMLAALYGGLRAGLLATALSALLADYFWIEPWGFGISDTADWLSMGIFLAGCTMISSIAESLHRAQAALALHRDHLEESVQTRTAALEHEVEERKRAEEQLRELSQRLSYHVDHSPLAVIEWGPDMRLIRWSQEAERLFGWAAEEVLGKRMEDFRWIYPEDGPRVAEVRSELETGTNPRRFSANRNYRKDGTVVDCEWYNSSLLDKSGELRSILSLVLDVTARKRAEEALRESEERLALGVEATALGTWDYDARARTTVWSKRCKALWGLALEEPVPPGTFSSLLHPDDRDEARAVLRRSLDPSGDGEYAHTYRIIRPDGAVRWIEARGKASFAEERGEKVAVRLVGTNLDVTDRTEQQAELLQAKETADAANRAKSDFLSHMSHEIRTPLNGIMGMTELALMEKLPPQAKEYLQLVKQSARALLGIINDILDLAKIEAGRVELERAPFDLGSAVGAVVSTLGVAAREKGLCIVHRLDADVPARLLGDEGRLRQVLVNLAGNAVKFTERGTVQITVKTAQPSAPAIGCTRLLFSVSDTGIGIPKEQLGSIFESFAQVKRSSHAKYGGTGLGLAIAKHLVELMGGAIGVESEPGKGSRFFFTAEFGLQAGAGEPLATEPEPHESPAPNIRPLRILLAEDNPVNQLFIKMLLERRGHHVSVASDGLEALAALTREPFDLALLDMQMPEVDGLEVARRVREGQVAGVRRDVPLVAVTAHALRGDRERFLAAGVDDYLSKPFDLKDLDRTLARWAERRPAAATTPEEGDLAPSGSLARVRNRLKDLLGRMPSTSVGRLVDLTLAGLRPELDKLRRAAESSDAPAVSKQAHALRGAWGFTFGTERMVEIAEALEESAEEGTLEGAPALVAELQREAERLRGFLETERQRIGF